MSRKNNISFVYTFALLLLLFTFASCKKENRFDCVKGTGKIGKETRTTKAFKKIYVYENVDVFIRQGNEFEVIVEAGEHIRELIKTEVKDSIISIDNLNKCNWSRSYKNPINVYVKCPSYLFLSAEGTGNITSIDTIKSSKLILNTSSSGNIDVTVATELIEAAANSSGDITIKGKTTGFLSDIGGIGFLNAKELTAGYIYLHAYTTGLCYVNCIGMIDCKLDDIGDIYCYGNPNTVNKEENDKGRLYLK